MTPTNNLVQDILDRLAVDRELVIRSTVANNPAEVKQHWENRTGRVESTNAIADQLVSMWRAGKKVEVNSIINVPFISGKGDALDLAFRYMRGEVSEAGNDPGNATMQRALRAGPFGSDGDPFADNDFPPAATTDAGGAEGGGFNWTSVMNSLPTLVGLFTQITGSDTPAPTGGGGGAPPAAKSGVPMWAWIVGGIVVVGLTIWGVVTLFKASK